MKLGIDVGNTMAFACSVENMDAQTHRGGIMHDLTTPQSPYGTPTVYYYSDGSNSEYSGEDAIRRAAREGKSPVVRIKSRLHESFTVNGTTISGSELMKKVMKPVIESAVLEYEKNVQVSGNAGTEPVKVMLSYPASFSQSDKNLLAKTVSEIRLDDTRPVEVTGTIPEPAAAGLSFLAETQDENMRTVFTVDIGGVTTDVSLVRLYPDGIRDGSHMRFYDIYTTDGLPDAGGEDFTDILAEMIELKVRENSGEINTRMRNDIRFEAEQAKIKLSSENSYDISLAGYFGKDIVVTREGFEANEKAQQLVERIMKLVRDVMADNREKADGILLTGGASQMPMIQSKLREQLPSYADNIRFYKPQKAIAYGAARYGVLENLDEGIPSSTIRDEDKKTLTHGTGIVRRRVEHSIGIRVFDAQAEDGGVHIIEFAPAGSTLPFESAYHNVYPIHESIMRFEVWEAKHSKANPQKVHEDYRKLTEIVLQSDHPLCVKDTFQVRISIDDRNTLYIDAHEKKKKSNKQSGRYTLT